MSTTPTNHVLGSLSPNSYFTILRYNEVDTPQTTPRYIFSEHQDPAIRIAPTYLLPPGCPLKFLACEYPFIVCAAMRCSGALVGPICIDSRNVILKPLSSSYITAITDFHKSQLPPSELPLTPDTINTVSPWPPSPEPPDKD